jgi:hypothetical protein
MSSVEFVLIAEAGILEAQALLLCESIRRFAGAYSRSPITVVSPRSARRPSYATLRKLDRLDADYLPLDIDSCCPEYGPSYRVHAAAHVERRSGPPVIVQLDSDTIFLAEPDLTLTECPAAARPVDIKGMCTTGAGDPFDRYWRKLCALVDVDYEQVPTVRTTVDGQTVRASYNAGLLATQRAHGIFQRTEDIFKHLVAAGMTPWTADGPTLRTGTGVLSGAATAYWGTSQAAFSLAAVAGNHAVRLLPDTHNVPLHMLDQLTTVPPRLVHVHYHGMLSAGAGDANPLVDGTLDLPAATVEWLRARLPLNPPSRADGSAHFADPRARPPAVSHIRSQAGAVQTRSPSLPRQQVILVLGMHRSGTSALAGVLAAMGAAAPKTVTPPNAANPRGHFESWPLAVAYNEMLATAGSSWHDWRQLDPRWMLSNEADQYRRNIKSLLIDELGDAPLCFIKDPRICRFLPFMSSILAEMNVSPVAFLVVRNPLEVAYSLKRRDDFPLPKSFLLWLRHTLEAEYHSRHMPRCVLRYPDFLVDARSHIGRAAEKTGLVWPAQADDTDGAIARFLTTDLYHERCTIDDVRKHTGITPWVRETCEIQDEIVADGERKDLLERLDAVRTAFDAECDLFGPAAPAAEWAAERLRGELAAWASDRESFTRALDDRTAERDALVHERDRAVGERDALRASHSWRLTAPLRGLRRLFARNP